MEELVERIRKLPGVKLYEHGEIGIGVSKLEINGNRIGIEIPRKKLKIGKRGLFSLGEKHDEVLHLSFDSERVHIGLDKSKLSEEFVKKLEEKVK